MGSPGPIAVIGAGSWGTAVAKLVADRPHPVRMWAREPEVVRSINHHHENTLFLPGVRLPDALTATGDPEEAVAGAEVVVNAVPTQHIRRVFASLRPPEATLLVSLSKGIEVATLSTPSEVFAEVMPGPLSGGVVCVSGPSFATEVAAGLPAAVVAASRDIDQAHRAQELLSGRTFRVYAGDDVVSVELGGALKNVIAIAAGIAAGLGLGRNTVAAIITRGLAEITRLGVARGGHPLTFAGLSGIGDLVLTCTGELSRNRQVGVELGKGRALEEILAGMSMVAEGVETTRAAHRLAEREGVEMPITAQVHEVLFAGKDPRRGVIDLMGRSLRDEREPAPAFPQG
jgi:glycerol-3-phosphate dehydrogenase (NAD(P)+)